MKYTFLVFFSFITLITSYSYYDLWKKLSIQCENSNNGAAKNTNELNIQKPAVLFKKEEIVKIIPKIEYVEIKNSQQNTSDVANQQKLNIPSDDESISNLLIANGQLNEAEELLSSSFEKDVQKGNTNITKADKLREVYAKQGKLQEYTKFLKNLPDNIDKASLIEDHIRYSMENGINNYDELIPLVKSEITKNAENKNLSYHLAELYIAKSDYQNAIDIYENSLRSNNSNPYAYYQLGNAYKNIGDIQSSEQAFYQASTLSPEYSNIIASEKQQNNTVK